MTTNQHPPRPPDDSGDAEVETDTDQDEANAEAQQQPGLDPDWPQTAQGTTSAG